MCIGFAEMIFSEKLNEGKERKRARNPAEKCHFIDSMLGLSCFSRSNVMPGPEV